MKEGDVMKNITKANIETMTKIEAKNLLLDIREDAVSTCLEDSRDCNEFAERMKEIFPGEVEIEEGI